MTNMTALAAAAAISALLGYFLRRTAKPEDVIKIRLSIVFSILALVIAAIYFYFRLTTSA